MPFLLAGVIQKETNMKTRQWQTAHNTYRQKKQLNYIDDKMTLSRVIEVSKSENQLARNSTN